MVENQFDLGGASIKLLCFLIANLFQLCDYSVTKLDLTTNKTSSEHKIIFLALVTHVKK